MKSFCGCGERTSDLVSNSDPSKVLAWIVEPGLNVRYRSCGAVSIIGTISIDKLGGDRSDDEVASSCWCRERCLPMWRRLREQHPRTLAP